MTDVNLNTRNNLWYEKKYYTRFLAVQAVYSVMFVDDYQDNGNISQLMEHLREIKEVFNFEHTDNTFLATLTSSIVTNFTQLDVIISPYLNEQWSLDRVDSVSLSIIKAAICELLSCTTPMDVIINEYVNIASCFLEISEVNFINAILDKILSDKKAADNIHVDQLSLANQKLHINDGAAEDSSEEVA